MKKCPVCKGNVDRRREERELSLQGRTVTVAQEFFWCAECESERMTPEMLDESLRHAVELIRKLDGLLSAEEIKKLRTNLGYTQIEFEAILGSGPKTVTRWERGTVAPSGAANRLLEMFRDRPFLAHEIAERLGLRNSGPAAACLAAAGEASRMYRLVIRPPWTSKPGILHTLPAPVELSELLGSWEADAGAESLNAFPGRGPRWQQPAIPQPC